MQPAELFLLMAFVAVIWYWMDGARAKEIAIDAGRRACKDAQVDFLDGTVVLDKIRLQRDRQGYVRFSRCFRFEFSSDGSIRYGGKIKLLGKRPLDISLDVHRMTDLHTD